MVWKMLGHQSLLAAGFSSAVLKVVEFSQGWCRHEVNLTYRLHDYSWGGLVQGGRVPCHSTERMLKGFYR